MKGKGGFLAWLSKNRFIVSALVMGVVSCFLGVFMLGSPKPQYLWQLGRSNRIALFNLWVDVVVGIFTIWGLKWAASEFVAAQVKPDLRLIIGRESEDRRGIIPLRRGSDELVGRDNIIDSMPVSQVIIGLFLENDQPKAARFVRITLRVQGAPSPKILDAAKPPSDQVGYVYVPKINVVRGEALFLQFGEELVVYQGDGVQLGNIRVAWRQGIRPKKIDLSVGLYSVDSRPKEITVSHPIRWAVSQPCQRLAERRIPHTVENTQEEINRKENNHEHRKSKHRSHRTNDGGPTGAGGTGQGAGCDPGHAG